MRSSLAFALAAGLLAAAGTAPAQACSDLGSSNCGTNQSWRQSYDEPLYEAPRAQGYSGYRDDANAYPYSYDDDIYRRDVDISNYAGSR